MRLSLCFRRATKVHRLVWLTESRAGIYLGMLGAGKDVHFSYHQDGNRHTKLGAESIHPNVDVPIREWVGIRQLQNMSISVSDQWLNLATAYTGDERTETVVVLDERCFLEKRRCSLDVWLFDRKSEPEMLGRMAGGLAVQTGFTMVAEVIVALAHFRDHKLGITLRSEDGIAANSEQNKTDANKRSTA